MSDDEQKTVTVHVTPEARRLLRLIAADSGKSMQDEAEEIFRREWEKRQAQVQDE